MAVDTALSKVARDIMKAVSKRRALPQGHALVIVIVKVPEKDDDMGKFHIAAAPAQETGAIRFILQEAADGITGETRVREIVTTPIIPTGNA
jgi:hypothetical protein